MESDEDISRYDRFKSERFGQPNHVDSTQDRCSRGHSRRVGRETRQYGRAGRSSRKTRTPHVTRMTRQSHSSRALRWTLGKSSRCVPRRHSDGTRRRRAGDWRRHGQRTVAKEPGDAPEGVQGIQVVVQSRRRDKHRCSICGERAGKLRRHVLHKHLPWYFSPELACWICCKYSASAADLTSRHLARHPGGFTGQEQLVRWMKTMATLISVECQILRMSPKELLQEGRRGTLRTQEYNCSPLRVLLLEWAHNFSQEKPLQTPVELEDCVEWVLCWDVQMNLLTRMSAEDRTRIKVLPMTSSSKEAPIIEVSDGHCHLLDTTRKMRIKQPLSQAAWNRLRGSSTGVGSHVAMVVDNHVFPNAWGKFQRIPGVVVGVSVGVHPRMVNGYVPWDRLERYWRRQECVAVGECGLDETAPDMAGQEELLQEQLRVARTRSLPVVLHVRSRVPSEADAVFGRCLKLVKGILPSGHPVYLHSFTGSYAQFLCWRSFTARLLVGFSWKTTEVADFVQLAGKVPVECLALESDAPHLAPPGVKINTPFNLARTAAKMSPHRGLPVAVVLGLASRNVRRFYRK